MDLLEYIRKNFPTPNTAVLRRLGASERLIDYLKHTSLNTNFNIVPQLIDGGEEDWDLVAESVGNGRIVWNSTGEIIWKEGEISCEKFALLKDILIKPYCYRVFARIEETQEFSIHYAGSSVFWSGNIDFSKRVSISYDSTIAVGALSLTMNSEAGTKCQLYIKKVEEAKTFTINWANDYQIYTNINIDDTLISPPSPPLEPGYIFDAWYVGLEKLGENESFIFTNEIAKYVDETKTMYVSYYAFPPKP